MISEFVSNAYDAESPKVEVQLPIGEITKNSEVIIRDFGHGMTAEEIQEEFLPIGRNRRGPDSKNVKSKNNKRRVTGRKGLGKLSAFGIASEIEVRSIKDKESVCLRLNYNDIKKWFEKHGSRSPYQPVVVKEKTTTTDEKDGVEITLRKFHRKNAISEDVVRRGLATRLSFIGRGFEVYVNGKKIVPQDRLTREECTQSWDVCDMPGEGRAGIGRPLKGWIGFLHESSQKGRGIDIYASGKAVELGSFFNYPSTHAQFARAHLVGQIHTDFLDDPEADHVATARNSVVWEREQDLENWGHDVLRWAFEEWLSERRRAKEQKVVVETGFDEWMKGRNPREKKVASRMVKLLVQNEDLDADSAKP
ncbi:ATP-binding protein, partial [bacterium]|nr:ATP-binding protein [bacterium]